MPYPVQNLIEGRDMPVSVGPTTPIQEALDLMIEHDFSQLPVINAGNAPIGMITHESILRALGNFHLKIDDLQVSSAIVKAPKYHVDDDLFDLLDRLQDTNAVLIVDSQDRLVSIVTTYDSTEYFRRRAEDIMLVEDIESMIKDLVLAPFNNSDGETDQKKLRAAIDDIASGSSELKKQYSRALRKYLELSENKTPTIQSAWLEQSFELLVPKVETKRFDELTLYEYTQLLLHPSRWNLYKDALKIGTPAIRSLLDGIRQTRNILAHFRGEISPVQRDQLRFCRDWLTQHQIGIPVNWPIAEPVLYPEHLSVAEPKAIYSASPDADHDIMPVEDVPVPGENRYAPLAIYLQSRPSKDDQVELSFTQIERILGDSLPASARNHRAWWANDSVSHVQSRMWLDVGWRVASINMIDQIVRFVRIKARERAYIDFYSALYDALEKRARFPMRRKVLGGVSWLTVANIPSEGTAIGTLNFAFSTSNRFRAELYIDSGDQTLNKRIFDILYSGREKIENAFGTKLSWERLDDHRASRISHIYEASITDEPVKLTELRAKAVTDMLRFEKVLRESVERARNTAVAPG